MRLICPNCDAQYDIADDVIPEGGRDVQCSSCAHTWFQTDKPKPAPAVIADAKTEEDAAPSPAAAPPPPPKRKPLESSIADILREEAEREHELAGKNAANADETRRRISQATGTGGSPASVAASATGAVSAHANLRTVPGIDEINASLRARAEANDTSGLTESEKDAVVERRGFRRGFTFVLVLIAILIAPYFFADQIVENLPQLEPYMDTYVATVDQLRAWLDVQVQAAQVKISELIASYQSAE